MVVSGAERHAEGSSWTSAVQAEDGPSESWRSTVTAVTAATSTITVSPSQRHHGRGPCTRRHHARPRFTRLLAGTSCILHGVTIATDDHVTVHFTLLLGDVSLSDHTAAVAWQILTICDFCHIRHKCKNIQIMITITPRRRGSPGTISVKFSVDVNGWPTYQTP